MTAGSYLVITARRASDLIYEIALQTPKGVWVLPNNVCPAVPLALSCAGADLRFVDIDAETLCLDTGKVIELAKTVDIAGVIYVRTFGMDDCAQNDLENLRNVLPKAALIDDRCIGVPQISLPENDRASDVILFSTGYGKVLDLGGGAYGFLKRKLNFKPGGRTLAPQVFEELLAQSSAAIKTGDPVFADFNFTAPKFSTRSNPPPQDWSDLSQSITNQLPDRLAHKTELNTIYAHGLVKFLPLADGYQNWRFHIFVCNQHQVVEALFGAGLFASSHYAPVSKLWNAKCGAVSQEIAKSIINLFNDQHFTAKQAQDTVAIINEIGKPLV